MLLICFLIQAVTDFMSDIRKVTLQLTLFPVSKRMNGFEVLHPMGWDAFGLSTEQYAIKTGIHPKIRTVECVARFKQQLKSLGFSYDWEREINTTDEKYFKWTQWIFLRIFNSFFMMKRKQGETDFRINNSEGLSEKREV